MTAEASPEPAADDRDTVLRVHHDTDGAVEILSLRGELDITTLDCAEREVQALEGAGPRVLVLDLSELEYVDSSGVRLVLLAEERARAVGRRLAVRLGTGPARRVFEVLGLVERLDVVDGASGPGASGPGASDPGAP